MARHAGLSRWRIGRTMVAVRVRATCLTAMAMLGVAASCDGPDDGAGGASSTIAIADEPARTPATSTSPSTTSPVTVTTSGTSTTTSTSVLAPTSTVAATMAISRPFLDPSICTVTEAWESRFEDHTIEMLFWISPDEPIPLQVVGDPALGTSGPFAMVLRLPEQMSDVEAGRELVTIGEWTVGVFPVPNGNGDAIWNLPDGGQGYLRSRDLSTDQIVAVIDSLSARQADAAIPGFDVDGPAALPLLTEHMSSGLDGRAAGITCRTDEEPPREYRVDAVDAEPVLEFLAILDRPRPLDAGDVGGTTIVIAGGLPTATSPRVEQVIDADQTTWDGVLRLTPQ